MLLSLCVLPSALAASTEEDVQRYLRVLEQRDPRLQAVEFEALCCMGLSDPRLFDEVEQRLLADHEAARTHRENKQRLAWYFRALGFSGQSKYQPTLQRFVDDRTYRNYAITALRESPQYAKWNPIISNRATFDPGRSDDTNRFVNMLSADDPLLHRVAAKRIFQTSEMAPAVADLLAERIRESYMKADKYDTEQLETVGWLLNALGRWRTDPKYASLLREVSARARAEKLRARALAALEGRR